VRGNRPQVRAARRGNGFPASELQPSPAMLHYAIVFLIIALIAAFLGFGALSGLAATIAKICFVVFLLFALFSFVKKKA
jgi:uncharacterized membrane protein YtjA (UPF0391 family)